MASAREIRKIVIVGSGQAGVEVAAALRQHGFDGDTVIVGEEPVLPYQRPPLSKEFLKHPADMGLPLKGDAFYPGKNIDLRLGIRAVRIDRADKQLALADGEPLAYDHLVLATGARNRIPPIPGLDSGTILELRTLADAQVLARRVDELRHVTVIGGGFIGLEVASLLRARAIDVDVVEVTNRLMGRVLSASTSSYFRSFHEKMGTRLHLATNVTGVEQVAGGIRVGLSSGLDFRTDAILIAAGVVPNSELAAEAGLAVGNGIIVDELLVTSDPAISALGDCAVYPSVHAGGMVRLESVQNAVDQARSIAARLTGEASPYAGLPWFWSNQGSARLQIAGLSTGYDDAVLRGDPEAGKFSMFLYRGDMLIAVESLNSAGDHMLARRLLAAKTPVAKAIAGDPTADLKALL